MGQRVVRASADPARAARDRRVGRVFETALGWIGIAGTEALLEAVVVGHDGSRSARHALGGERLWDAHGWPDAAEELITRYARGEAVEFDRLPVCLGRLTPFQEAVVLATRGVGYGETVSYGELACRAGSPGAARAVGSVMAKNRLPLVVPCHRVLGAGGALGGYSCPQGTEFKMRLLELERAHTPEPGGSTRGRRR